MKRLLAFALPMVTTSAWSAYLCGVQRVDIREPQDPHGVWELVVTTEWVPRMVTHKDGSKDDLAYQQQLGEQRFMGDVSKPRNRQRGFVSPWPPRFALREGDTVYEFMGAHENCELAAKAVNDRLTLQVTGTSCYNVHGGKCSSSTQLIGPMPATP
jgi:hypothetical protein